MAWSTAAWAVPVEQEFRKTQAALEKAQAQYSKRGEKLQEIEKQQEALQKETVRMTEALSEAEVKQDGMEEQLAALEAREAEQRATIERNKARIQALTEALVQLRLAPDTDRIALPEDVREGVHTALSIRGASEALTQQSAEVRKELAALAELRKETKEAREAADTQRQTLKMRQADLAVKLEERKMLFQKLHGEHEREAAEIEALQKKAKSLSELVDSLNVREAAAEKARVKQREAEKTQAAAEAEKPAKREAAARPRTLRPFAAMQGKLRPPVAGSMSQGFRDKGGEQRPSQQGVAFSTSANATVRAVYDGEVVFAGPFRGYGKLIILRHSDGYHTLVSGLERLNVQPGQFVLEGEAIGAMGNGAGKARLYLELRRDNRPVDPGPWFAS